MVRVLVEAQDWGMCWRGFRGGWGCSVDVVLEAFAVVSAAVSPVVLAVGGAAAAGASGMAVSSEIGCVAATVVAEVVV